MTKETVCITEKKTELTVTNSKISAVMRSNIQKTGIRLYDNGCLGIAGAIGAYNEEELIKNAGHMLKFRLPYEGQPTSGVRRSLDLSGKLAATDKEFVEFSGNLMGALEDRNPKFIFSHKLSLIETEESLVNDAGTELMQKDKRVEFMLILKQRESKNSVDGFSAVVSREMDFDMVIKELSWICQAYENKVDFSEAGERIPVVLLCGQEFLQKFITDLEGNEFGSGASMFSGKTGEKLFDDKFSLIINRDTDGTFNRFYDGEGTVLPQDRFAMIENGVLKAPYSTKRIAFRYDLPLTGSASFIYDSVPAATEQGIEVARSDKTLKELLGGRKAVYAVVAEGGDFTPQGEYASPIQAAYLYDGENYLGRLPQLSMSSHVNDMFGKDFIGASSNGSYPGCPVSYLAIEMNVRKIDSWM